MYQQFNNLSAKEKKAILEMHKFEKLGPDDFEKLNDAVPDSRWSNTRHGNPSNPDGAKHFYDLYIDKYGPYTLISSEDNNYLGYQERDGHYKFYAKNDTGSIPLAALAEKLGMSEEELKTKIEEA